MLQNMSEHYPLILKNLCGSIQTENNATTSGLSLFKKKTKQSVNTEISVVPKLIYSLKSSD